MEKRVGTAEPGRSGQGGRSPGGGRALTEEIAETLAAEIVGGEIAAGAWLRQDRVAQRFQASHVPVREAFRRLEARGLLESLPRRGVRVPPLTAAQVVELSGMRVALECLALREAAGRLTAADFAAAEAALAEAEGADSLLHLEAANRRFHRALYAPAAMPRLLRTVEELQEASARYLFAAWRDLQWQPRSQAEHQEILAALRLGETAQAEALLARHIGAAGRSLAEALPA
ncbi:MAG: GntR family transcriptional regulator [Rhodospirillales bacterium]